VHLGQTGANGYGTDALLYNNVLAAVAEHPGVHDAFVERLDLRGVNFHGLAAAALENFGYGTAATYAPFGGDYQNPNGFSAGVSIGVLLPSAGNNDNNQLRT
jgi:hypothetical protein